MDRSWENVNRSQTHERGFQEKEYINRIFIAVQLHTEMFGGGAQRPVFARLKVRAHAAQLNPLVEHNPPNFFITQVIVQLFISFQQR